MTRCCQPYAQQGVSKTAYTIGTTGKRGKSNKIK